jgi:hypothetical protein
MGRKPKDPSLKQVFINNNFSKVISLIENGYTICEALDKININRTDFYNHLSKTQKLELRFVKTLNRKYHGTGSNFYDYIKD